MESIPYSIHPQSDIDKGLVNLSLQKTVITEDETAQAIKNTGLKATGIDNLPVKRIKDPIYRKAIVTKCTIIFNEWMANGKVPEYLKEARIVPLAKEDTEYPNVGAIRTVNILPSIFKIFEKVVLGKLKVELREKAPLHPC